MKQRIIMPKGGIPRDYYASGSSQNTRPKSPRYIRNTEIAKPQKLDKEKIKNNMQNMKQLLEKKGIYKRPFIIEPPNYHPNNQDNIDNQDNNNQNNQDNKDNQNNQINQDNQINQTNQDNQINQENKNSQINQENKNNQINQVNQNNKNVQKVQNNQNNQKNKNNQENKIEGLFSHNKFLAAKSVFEARNNEAINKNYQNKPVRKDVKKKAKSAFDEF